MRHPHHTEDVSELIICSCFLPFPKDIRRNVVWLRKAVGQGRLPGTVLVVSLILQGFWTNFGVRANKLWMGPEWPPEGSVVPEGKANTAIPGASAVPHFREHVLPVFLTCFKLQGAPLLGGVASRPILGRDDRRSRTFHHKADGHHTRNMCKRERGKSVARWYTFHNRNCTLSWNS